MLRALIPAAGRGVRAYPKTAFLTKVLYLIDFLLIGLTQLKRSG
jgi:UTP-glucose-1-phosphate uridylyltransferase